MYKSCTNLLQNLCDGPEYFCFVTGLASQADVSLFKGWALSQQPPG